jgi:hypothetical protein
MSVWLRIAACVTTAVAAARISIAAPNTEDLRHAFIDIRDDKIPRNCEHATTWLMKYREEIKDDLLDELYKTDAQGRDTIIHILLTMDSFIPDDRFLRFFVARLSEKDTFWWDDHENWTYINNHFDVFDSLLREQVPKIGKRPNDMYVTWAIAWLAKKRGIFGQYSSLFTPAVLAKVAENLRGDDSRYNASQAVRLFLLFGDQSLPTLRVAVNSSDTQGKRLARATIDALAGKRVAFGYLASKLYLERTPFGPEVDEPDWLSVQVEKYLERENYP